MKTTQETCNHIKAVHYAKLLNIYIENNVITYSLAECRYNECVDKLKNEWLLKGECTWKEWCNKINESCK